MQSFTYDQPATRVVFGAGAFDRLADEVKHLGGKRALVLCGPDGVIRPENLPPDVLRPARPRYQLPVDVSRPLTEQLTELTAAFEERYLRRALKRTRAHIGRTARLTGLSRRTITEKLALYQIDKNDFKKD